MNTKYNPKDVILGQSNTTIIKGSNKYWGRQAKRFLTWGLG